MFRIVQYHTNVASTVVSVTEYKVHLGTNGFVLHNISFPEALRGSKPPLVTAVELFYR